MEEPDREYKQHFIITIFADFSIIFLNRKINVILDDEWGILKKN